MKYLPLSFLLLLSFTACDKHEEFMPTFQVQEVTGAQADIVAAFSGLTGDDEDACNLVFSSEEIPDLLCNIVADARAGSEIVLLIDKTSSMADDIDEVRRNADRIIECLPEGVRLAAAAYGDARSDGFAWYTSSELSEDFSIARAFIQAISLVGGGDAPESVYDAIYRVMDEMNWQDCSAPDKVIVMGDAPPHTGSRTTYNIEDILRRADEICRGTEFFPVLILER